MHTLSYNVFDPARCAFPPPRVPLLPMLTRSAVARSPSGDFALVATGRARRSYTRGRYALYDAYRLSGVGSRGSLLAPAYHCRTMLDPAINLNAPLLLYGLDAQLAPDFASLERLVRSAEQPVRAMLLTHYFGFAQQVAPIKAFCDAHGIALIEDCSHALFDLRGAERLGEHGRYTIASPYKLFPCEEGGLLIPALGVALPTEPNRAPGVRAELKGLASAIESSWKHYRDLHRGADLARLDDDIRRIAAEPIERGAQTRAELTGTSPMYLDREQGLAGSAVSGWLMKLCDIGHVAARRRANYARWNDAVRGLPHCRPLFAELPANCVPYMFPLLIEHPQPHFYVLKKLGMPIWRWDEMAVSDCATAQHYRQHVLHVPCHQALSERELDWMTSAVAKVMRQVPVPLAAHAAAST